MQNGKCKVQSAKCNSRMNTPPPADVRMRGFASRASVDAAWQWVDTHALPLNSERVPLARLAGRVLVEAIVSQVDVPPFRRAMMDGFAVRATDTAGASVYNRAPLTVAGSILPGQLYPTQLLPGQAIAIMTGAPMPGGADAVLPAEKVQAESSIVYALDEVSPDKHVGRRGEDITAGTRVLPEHRRLRPQDLGVLSSIGVSEAQAVRQPRVRILITGSELLPPGTKPTGCRVADANSPMLAALVRRDGGVLCHTAILPDEPSAILNAMRDDADVVLVSGGSSVGQEDYAPVLLAEHGELAIHGIAMRPSSPAGMGKLGHRLVFLLPGNPVSCLCAYDFFAGRAIRALGGLPRQWPYRSRRAPLGRKLVSMVGRVDYARVRLHEAQVEPLAISGASVLSSTTRADGFVVVPENHEGYPAGTEVDVWMYD